jgi:hypothetical protein
MKNMKVLNSYLAEIQDVELNEIVAAAATAATAAAGGTIMGKVLGGMTAIYSVTSLIRLAHQLGKDYLTKAGRACVDLKGSSQNLCVIQFKIRSLDKEIQELNRAKSKCSKTFNTQKCNMKINEKLQKLHRMRSDLQKHYALYQQKQRQEVDANRIGI